MERRPCCRLHRPYSNEGETGIAPIDVNTHTIKSYPACTPDITAGSSSSQSSTNGSGTVDCERRLILFAAMLAVNKGMAEAGMWNG